MADLLVTLFALSWRTCRAVTPRLIMAFAAMTLVMFVSANSALAQRCYPPGTLRIAGMPFNCGAATTCVDARIGDLGRAAPGQGIWLHPALNSYPPGVIGFLFAHECAHFLGIMDEQEADRWAIRIGRDQGWINLLTVQQICQAFYFSPGDWTHFPGPLRCANMVDTFNR